VAEPNVPEPLEPRTLEVDVEPTMSGRVARWAERARLFRSRVEASRAEHVSVDFGFNLVERDSTVGGGLFAGALAYRLFVLLLPTALLFVSGLGLYADAADKSPTTVAKEAGLTGLIAAEVASASSGKARSIVFLTMIPIALYAVVKLYRSVAMVHGIVWQGSGRGARATPKGIGLFIVMLVTVFVALEILSWIRRHDQFVGVLSLLLFLFLVGGAWLLVETQLPHRDVPWTALLPGAALFGVGLLLINVFNVYVTTRLVQGRADTYGALGVAAALLFSLVLVGRLVVASAVLNVSLHDMRAAKS
jgi:membrane protein